MMLITGISVGRLGACTLCFAFIRHLPDRCRSSINQRLGRPIIDRSRASSINQRSIGLSDQSLIDRWSMVDRCRSHRPADRWLSLENGANLEAEDKDGKTPLVRAAGYGYERIVNLLIEKGANIESKDNVHNQTPLLWAVMGNHMIVTKMLLENGANLVAEENEGYTALVLATSHDYEMIVDLLI